VKDPRPYLAHILECIRRIESYTAAGREAFLASPMMQDAVIRNFVTIGEATKRLPDDFRREHPEIPWRGMAAFRDVLTHDYEDIDLNEVWRVIEVDLPRARTGIAALVPPLAQLEAELAGDTEPPDRSGSDR